MRGECVCVSPGLSVCPYCKGDNLCEHYDAVRGNTAVVGAVLNGLYMRQNICTGDLIGGWVKPEYVYVTGYLPSL
jgi:hypothetical protein